MTRQKMTKEEREEARLRREHWKAMTRSAEVEEAIANALSEQKGRDAEMRREMVERRNILRDFAKTLDTLPMSEPLAKAVLWARIDELSVALSGSHEPSPWEGSRK